MDRKRNDPANIMLITQIKTEPSNYSNLTDRLDLDFPNLPFRNVYLIFENTISDLFSNSEEFIAKITTDSKDESMNIVSFYLTTQKKKSKNNNFLIFLLKFDKMGKYLLNKLRLHNITLHDKLVAKYEFYNDFDFMINEDDYFNEHNILQLSRKYFMPTNLVYNIAEVPEIPEITTANGEELTSVLNTIRVSPNLNAVSHDILKLNDEDLNILIKKYAFYVVTNMSNETGIEIEKYKKNIKLQLYIFGLYIKKITEKNEINFEDWSMERVDPKDDVIEKIDEIINDTDSYLEDQDPDDQTHEYEFTLEAKQKIKDILDDYVKTYGIENNKERIVTEYNIKLKEHERLNNKLDELREGIETRRTERERNVNEDEEEERRREERERERNESDERDNNEIIAVNEKISKLDVELKNLSSLLETFKIVKFSNLSFLKKQLLLIFEIKKITLPDQFKIIAAAIYIYNNDDFKKIFDPLMYKIGLLTNSITLLKQQNIKIHNLILSLLYPNIEVVGKNNMLLTSIFNNKIKIYK